MHPLEEVVSRSPKLRPRTKIAYLANIREFLAYVSDVAPELHSDHTLPQAKAWVDIVRPKVEEWRDALLKRGLDTATVNGRLAALRYATRRWSERTGDPSFNFALYAETLSAAGKDTKARHALTLDDVRTILEPCRQEAAHGDLFGIRDTALITLATYTGLRRDALARLTAGAIKDWCLKVELKGGKLHTLPPLDKRAQEALAVWLKALHDEGCKTRGDAKVFRHIKKSLEGPLIGEALSANGIYHIVNKRAEQVGLKAHPHLFRHTFITMMEEAGLGHLTAAYTGHKGGRGAVPPSQETYTDRVAMAEREGTAALPDLGSKVSR